MDILLSRQPIFDRDEEIAGYELYYRDAAQGDDPSPPTGAARGDAQSVLVNAFLGIGLERVSEGKAAFIDVTHEMLLTGAIELLDPTRIVLELADAAEADEEVVASCESLVRAGYRLALDDFVFDERTVGLLKIAEIVKLDVRRYPGPALAGAVSRLRPFRVQLLAENVENRTARDHCLELGFELFQGYDFSRPEVLTRRDVGIDHLRTFRLMRQIRDLDVTDAQIEEAFRSDLALSYKLLRMVNSASVGARGIQSIGHAIRLLGREALHRWLALLLLSSISERGVKAEIVHTALLRARLCEMLAAPAGRPAAAGSLFIVGLISLLDILLGTSMEELVTQMDLSPEVTRALLDRQGFHGVMLRMVEAYDLGHWDYVEDLARSINVPSQMVARHYLEALSWANERTLETSGAD